MTVPTYDDVVEAMARARYARFALRMNAALQPMPPWDQLPEMMQKTALEDERAALRAQHDLGLLLVAGVPDAQSEDCGFEASQLLARGWNNYHAKLLARVVEVPNADTR